MEMLAFYNFSNYFIGMNIPVSYCESRGILCLNLSNIFDQIQWLAVTSPNIELRTYDILLEIST